MTRFRIVATQYIDGVAPIVEHQSESFFGHAEAAGRHLDSGPALDKTLPLPRLSTSLVRLLRGRQRRSINTLPLSDIGFFYVSRRSKPKLSDRCCVCSISVSPHLDIAADRVAQHY